MSRLIRKISANTSNVVETKNLADIKEKTGNLYESIAIIAKRANQINISLKDLLPEDSETAGFDTVGDGLGISTEHLLGYLQASDQLVTKILEPDPKAPHISVRIPFSQEPALSPQLGKFFLKLDDESLVIFQEQTRRSVFYSAKAKVDGTYRCRIQAKTYQSKRPLVMELQAGDTIGLRLSRLVGYYDIVPSDEWTVVEFESFLKKNDYISIDPYRLRATGKGDDVFNYVLINTR